MGKFRGMYASHGFLRSDIGDVDVVFHEGIYHLFHLVLPNHDFIAHAVSSDGLSWRRVKNAFFVGDPGAWDDDMLWTMHVTPDPDRPGQWRMFYTGLTRAEFGRVQRVGLARSPDLYAWTRCGAPYPLEIGGPHYESGIDEGRRWVSFRDPFFFHEPETGTRLLLAAARAKDGPVIRRGCVGLAREVAPDRFEFGPPLHRPGLYDDIEVPNLFHFHDRYYLMGSIREDTKIHYWYSDRIEGPYENFCDDVLLPHGNYAGRICRAGDRLLLFSFFSKTELLINGHEFIKRLLPPPKEIVALADGRLRLKSYRGFDGLVTARLALASTAECRMLCGNPTARAETRDDSLSLGTRSGFEAFLLPGQHDEFRLRAEMTLEGPGKTGLILRASEEGDGYYLSLDCMNGIAQMRAWGANPTPEFEHAFRYKSLQEARFRSSAHGPWQIEVVAHGTYLELSIDGYVVLSLVDDSFICGAVGFYVESATLGLCGVTLETLSRPVSEHAAEMVYTATQAPDLLAAAGAAGE